MRVAATSIVAAMMVAAVDTEAFLAVRDCSSNTIRQPAQSAHLDRRGTRILCFALSLLHRHRESIDRSKDLDQTGERGRAWQMPHGRHSQVVRSIAPGIAREGRETRFRCEPDQHPGRRETASSLVTKSPGIETPILSHKFTDETSNLWLTVIT